MASRALVEAGSRKRGPVSSQSLASHPSLPAALGGLLLTQTSGPGPGCTSPTSLGPFPLGSGPPVHWALSLAHTASRSLPLHLTSAQAGAFRLCLPETFSLGLRRPHPGPRGQPWVGTTTRHSGSGVELARGPLWAGRKGTKHASPEPSFEEGRTRTWENVTGHRERSLPCSGEAP